MANPRQDFRPVQAFLERHGLSQYARLLEDQECGSISALLSLRDSDFEEMGVSEEARRQFRDACTSEMAGVLTWVRAPNNISFNAPPSGLVQEDSAERLKSYFLSTQGFHHVQAFLERSGLSQYGQVLKEQECDSMAILISLRDSDLEEMGVDSEEARLQFMNACALEMADVLTKGKDPSVPDELSCNTQPSSIMQKDSAPTSDEHPCDTLPSPLPQSPSGLCDEDAERVKSYFLSVRDTMPSCAERSLVLLYSHFSYQAGAVSQPRPPLLTPNEVQDTYDLLVKQWEAERHTMRLPSWEDLQAASPKVGEQLLVQLLTELRPVDMQVLMALIGRIEVASRAIKGKDVILLLGYTGSGKSTLIHYLAGSKLQASLHH